MLSFDPSVSIGTILNIIGLMVAAVTLYGRTSKTLAIFEVNYKNAMTRLDRIEGDVERLTKVTEIIALQKERMNTLDQRVSEVAADTKDRLKLLPSRPEIENMINAAIKPQRVRKKAV